MSHSRFIIGIDFGNQQASLAYLDTHSRQTPQIKLLDIPQVVQPGVVEASPLLPCFIYLPAEGELPGGSLGLPWDAGRKYVVGWYAQERGGEVVGRGIGGIKALLSALPHPPLPGLAALVSTLSPRGRGNNSSCAPRFTQRPYTPLRGNAV